MTTSRMIEVCLYCGHDIDLHCGHDMMCNYFTPDDSPEGGHYCNCWNYQK